MSVSNVTIFELHDENKANEWISWYNIQGPIGFSTADILLFVRTGPLPAYLFQYILVIKPEKRALKLEMNFKNNNLSI